MLLSDRLRKAFEKQGITPYKAEKETKIGRSLIGKYLAGESEPSASNVILLANFLNVSLEWLLTGKGGMNKTEIIRSIGDEISYPLKPYIESTYALCGQASGFEIAVRESDCDTLSLPFIKEYDFSIKAKGDSMINRKDPRRSIKEGDIVACKIWKSRSHIRWGEIYALSTSEGIVIKKVVPSELQGHVKCVSFNIEDGYEPYDMPLAEISDWALVIGVVSAINWN